MLLGSNLQKPKYYSDNFNEKNITEMEFCAQLIIRSQYIEAWTLLNSSQPESIPLLINKAICLIGSQNHSGAVTLLEKALTLLIPQRPVINTPTTPEADNLRHLQNETNAYLEPITFRYVDLFSHLLNDSISRMLVDCYSSLGNTAKVLAIGTPLKSKGYSNITQALNKIG